jgi:hypothetical protein
MVGPTAFMSVVRQTITVGVCGRTSCWLYEADREQEKKEA